MINRIVEWFTSEKEIIESLDPNLATAVLLVEVSMSDNEWGTDEEIKIKELLSLHLKLSEDEQFEVLSAAKELVLESNDLYRFTNQMNETLDTEAKYNLLVLLWQVAFADGEIDRYEDHIIRKISELLYLHHSHFIKAKHQAQELMGQI